MKSKIKKSLGNLSEKVTTADKIEISMGNSATKQEMLPISLGKATWISDIELYCGEMGILPNDLILCHKEAKLGLKSKKGTKTPKDGEIGSTEVGSAKNNRSNWFKDYKKAKTGISE